ncbi:hypothetical protein NC651_001430 [Populus alba x Populus x berolinensis]|nr:hypothetical protein NC651_001430 [Populus alba x Populus x berolinensis]
MLLHGEERQLSNILSVISHARRTREIG